jgi:hypothetical protein
MGGAKNFFEGGGKKVVRPIYEPLEERHKQQVPVI